jgi:PAS domain S-box-containing protein
MVLIQLIYNLATLVALSVVSGFIDQRWRRDTSPGTVMQGILFGAVAVIGMVHPLELSPGLFFDGRSIVISLCGMFFGPLSAAIAAAAAIVYRIAEGGIGAVMGVSVIAASALIGIGFYYYRSKNPNRTTALQLLVLGLIVHGIMLLLAFTLPYESAIRTLQTVGLPVIVIYPLATVLVGKILLDQEQNIRSVEKLSESELRWKYALEGAGDGIWDWNVVTNRIFFSTQWKKMLGYAEDEVGDTLEEWETRIHPDDRIRCFEDLQRHLDGKTADYRNEHRIRCRDGSYKWILDRGKIIEWTADGTPLRMIGTHTDIDERNRGRAAMEERNIFIQTVLDNLPVGIAVNDIHTGNVSYVNEKFYAIYGIDRDEIHNVRRFFEVMFTDPEHRMEIQKRVMDDIASGDPARMQWDDIPITRQSGQKRFISARNIPIPGQGMMVSTVQDITEIIQNRNELRRFNRELEERVARRTEQLEAVNRELEAFAYSVSHDLRSPLRAIDGFSRFLAEDYGHALDDEGRRLLGVIRSNAQKMDRLITDLLSLSRVTRNEMKNARIEMEAMVRSVFAECVDNDARSEFEFIVHPLADADGDPFLMRLVWTNLIENAVKYSARSEIKKIEIGWRRLQDRHVYYIRDRGAGFNPKYKDSLFKVFQRLHSDGEFEGTGVGLAIVQRILRRHGGTVWADGGEGTGATFYFSLPAQGDGSEQI